MGVYEAVRLTEKVYWVGAIDWSIRDFHGYSTGRGSTYNAYLIMAEKPTLVDTVKKPFLDEMMSRIASVTDPENIEIVVSNHSEMDHTGALPETLRTIKPNKVYASTMGGKALKAHFHWKDDPVDTVSSGDELDLGDMTLKFIETRMLHWPDSMVSYLEEEKVLFSQDGFGMHLAGTRRFDDEIDKGVLEFEARKYYANILMPFSPLVKGLLANLKKMDLEIDLLCPDHGPVWRSRIDWILELWGKWAQQTPCRRASVIYDTMWGSTGAMARAVTQGLVDAGLTVRMMPLRQTHISDIAAELLISSAIVVGSPTINGRIFPSVAECMNYIGGLKPANMVGGAFGSYGWSGEAVKELNGLLEGMKVELADEGFRTMYVPDEDALAASRDLGRSVGKLAMDKCREND